MLKLLMSNMSEHKLSDKEIEEIVEKLDREKIYNENDKLIEEELKKEIKRLTSEREVDPTYYKGIWINNIQKVKRELGYYSDNSS